MNIDEALLCRIMFQRKVAFANGQAYEDMFTEIMRQAHKDFKQVKPQGKVGDRKNDGYREQVGHYYQVFAPEEPKESEGNAVKKLKTDFKGLKKGWDKVLKVKSFSFVFNDKYSGTFPTIEEDLAEIKKTNKLDVCDSFLAKDLEDTLFSLDDANIFSILGGRPPRPENISNVDFGILKEVIDHIFGLKLPIPPDGDLEAPVFAEKIEFNGLSPVVAKLLNKGNIQSGALEGYFKLNSNFAKQKLREKLNSLYLQSKHAMSSMEDFPHKADVVFFNILREISPDGNESHNNAAIIVMAAYFETCDIFEDPSKGNSNANAK